MGRELAREFNFRNGYLIGVGGVGGKGEEEISANEGNCKRRAANIAISDFRGILCKVPRPDSIDQRGDLTRS